jgi:hypothetical protein
VGSRGFQDGDFLAHLKEKINSSSFSWGRKCLDYLALLQRQFARRGNGPEDKVYVWKSMIAEDYLEFGFRAQLPSWDMMCGWPRFAYLNQKCLPGDLKCGDTEVVAIKMWIHRDLDIWKEFCQVFASLPNLREMELHFDSFDHWSQHFELLCDLGLKKLSVNFAALKQGGLSNFAGLEVLSVRGYDFSSVHADFFLPTISAVCVVDQDNNKGDVAEFLVSIPKDVQSLTLCNFKVYRFKGVMDAVFGPCSHFETVVLEGNYWIFISDPMDYLSALLDGNTVLKTLEVEYLHQCVFDIFARRAKALQTLRVRRAIQWIVLPETRVAFKESSLERFEFLGRFFDAPILSPIDLLRRLAEQRRREADQRGRCLLFCCLQQAPHNAPDKTTTLGAIPLHVLKPSVEDAANCFITEKPDATRKRAAAQSAQEEEPATKKRQPPEGPTH